MEYGKCLVKMQFVSHIYGTNTPSSDMDWKAIHVPPARDIVLGSVRESINISTKLVRGSKNEPGDVDYESFSFKKYMDLLLQGQTVALDMLFTPRRWWVSGSAQWEMVVGMRKEWLHRGVSAFVGYCRQQANKYGIKGSRVAAARAAVEFFGSRLPYRSQTRLIDVWGEIEDFASSGIEHVRIIECPVEITCRDDTRWKNEPMLEVCNRKVQKGASLKMAYNIYKKLLDEYGERALQAEKNEGVDWKALMHAVRVCGQAKELLMSSEVTFPRPEAELLLKIRAGLMPYKEVAEIIEQGMVELEIAQVSSVLPEKPNSVLASDFVYGVYSAAILGHHGGEVRG